MSIDSRSKQYGNIFGDWHISRRLDGGSNSKSAVFELYRNSNGWTEYCALKVVSLIEERGHREELSPYRETEYSTAAREQRRSAEQEVRLMEQLRGKTNIVDYLDHSFFEWHDEEDFGVDLLIRMERLKDLRTQMREGRRFSDGEITKIGRDICAALALCHGKDIIHRDIKPENIFYNDDGDYKLGDFGISRVMERTPAATASTGVGTPAYSAPEQHSGSYDKRVDIYSLGLVLYELCNGNRLPFAKSSYVSEGEIQLRLAGTPLPLPGEAAPANDPFATVAASGSFRSALRSEKLVKVVMKACMYRPEQRFASAQEMLDALSDEAAPIPPEPEPAPAPPRQSRWKEIAALAVLILGLAIAAGFFASKWISGDESEAPLSEPGEAAETTPEPDRTVEIVGEPARAAETEPTPEPSPEPIPEESPEPLTVTPASGGLDALTKLFFSQAEASSTFYDKQFGLLSAELAIDGRPDTSWQEGVEGMGEGESLTLRFASPQEVSALRLYTGYTYDERTYRQNGRPRSLLLEFSNGESCTVVLDDLMDRKDLALSRPVATEYLRITILSVYTYDIKWEDTAISEVIAYGGAIPAGGSATAAAGGAPTRADLAAMYSSVRTVSTQDVELALPTESEMLAVPFRAKIVNAQNSIYVRPVPIVQEGNGNLGTIRAGSVVWIVAQTEDFYFFTSGDTVMGWAVKNFFERVN